MHGKVVSEVLLGQRTFDLVVRLDEPFREDIESIERLRIDLPDGGTTSLGAVAKVYPASGPNTINREQVRRRIVIQCNTVGPGAGRRGAATSRTGSRRSNEALPTGYFVEYGGQFQSQQSATRVMAVLACLGAGRHVPGAVHHVPLGRTCRCRS